MTIEETIMWLKAMLNEPVSEAELYCAESYCVGGRMVYPDPEDYAIVEAIKALEEQEKYRWVSVDERLPSEHDGDYLLLSFENFSLPLVGRYEEDCDGGGNFYLGDEEMTLLSQDIIVNAWRRLPECYKGE